MDTQDVPRLVLAPGRERSLKRRHPWIFSQAVARVSAVEAGDTVAVYSSSGQLMAWAAYSPKSRIAARVWSFAQDESIDHGFFAARVERAVEYRKAVLSPAHLSACRLIHAEADGLPGLVVDRYGDQLVLQATSAGARHHRHAVARLLSETTGVAHVYERSEGEILELEGIDPQRGALLGDEPTRNLVIEEQLGAATPPLRFAVDIVSGQKTGFYLDQRDSRALLHDLASGRDVLDCFCHSGAFALAACAGGARSVTAVDSSEAALSLAREHLRINAIEPSAVAIERADVFHWLRGARDRARSFDMIVLDPPKLAPTARHVERAARAYKDINLLAFKLLRPGGLLLTFSCSAGVSAELFQKIVAGAAVDARREATVLRRLIAAPDHPLSLAFPEGDYLTGLLCKA